jgi:hypothetical protein
MHVDCPLALPGHRAEPQPLLCLFKDVWDTLRHDVQGCTLLQQLQLLVSEHASTQLQGYFGEILQLPGKMAGIPRGAHA